MNAKWAPRGDNSWSRLHNSPARMQWRKRYWVYPRYTTALGNSIQSAHSLWGTRKGMYHTSWRLSRVAGSIAGRYHQRQEELQKSEWVSWSSDGSWKTSTDSPRPATGIWWKGLYHMVKNHLMKQFRAHYPPPLPTSTLPKHPTMQARLMRIGTHFVNVVMIMADDGDHIPKQYPDVVEVFLNENAVILWPQRAIDHANNQESDHNNHFGGLTPSQSLNWMCLRTLLI